MNKIWLVIKREYLVRIQKKSFIIMTIITPLLIAAIMVLPIYMANKTSERRIIGISDDNKYIFDDLKDTKDLHFTSIPKNETNNINIGTLTQYVQILLQKIENID